MMIYNKRLNRFAKRALIVFLLMPFLYSCSPYNKSMVDYHQNVTSHNYEKANNIINKSKFFRKKRNKLLSDFENGRLNFLTSDYQKSNDFLNAADDILESNFKTGKDVAVSNLISPIMETYRGEEFEKFLIYFYKALNYSELGKPEDAIVEARRITLASDRLEQKVKNTNKYNKDAFSLNLQGMLYETGGDINNAFISYRNAANIYLEKNNRFYGVRIPEQLKTDLLRTASEIGFVEEKERYETIFNKKYNAENQERELILFIEEGNGPTKKETRFTITHNNRQPVYNFYGQDYIYHSVPFDYTGTGINITKLLDDENFEIALPTYSINYNKIIQLSISLNDSSYHDEIAQDLNQLSVAILQERLLSDLAKVIIRYQVKHSTGKGAKKIATKIAEKKGEDSSDTEKEKKKKTENAALIGDIVGFLASITNAATEVADTRCWLSLPAYIKYVRLPLKDGENSISIVYQSQTKVIKVSGKKGIQIKSIQL